LSKLEPAKEDSAFPFKLLALVVIKEKRKDAFNLIPFYFFKSMEKASQS